MDEQGLNEKQKKIKATGCTVKISNFLLVISIINLSLTVFFAFSFLGLVLYYLILIIILFLTLFTLFNQVMEWFDKGEIIQEFLGTVFQYIPYFIGVGISCATIALILFIINKNYIHRTAKIITTSVIIGLYVISALLRFIVFAGN